MTKKCAGILGKSVVIMGVVALISLGGVIREGLAQSFVSEFTVPSVVVKPSVGAPLTCEPKVVSGRVLDGVADLTGNYPLVDYNQVPAVKGLCDQSTWLSASNPAVAIKCPPVLISSDPAARGARVPCTSCTGNPQGSCVNTGFRPSCDVVIDTSNPNRPDPKNPVSISAARVRVQARLLCFYDCRNSK